MNTGERTRSVFKVSLLRVVAAAVAFLLLADGAANAVGNVDGDVKGNKVSAGGSEESSKSDGAKTKNSGTTRKAAGASAPKPPPPPRFYNVHSEAPLAGRRNCVKHTGGFVECRASQTSCVRQASYSNRSGDFVATAHAGPVVAGQNQATRRVTRVDRKTDARTDLGETCVTTSPATTSSGGDAGEPVVITVTVAEFKRLGVKPVRAHVGPNAEYLPVNMVNVLYADPAEQELHTTLLGTPVAIRAIPTSYHWDLGDGNTITTTKPGKPWPSEEVSSKYMNEGWYDVTLTTTFAGQFSVDGGPWQDIDGTIEIASDPIPIYSKSLVGHLTNPHDTTWEEGPRDIGYDPATDTVPTRTPDTEGPRDTHARHRHI